MPKPQEGLDPDEVTQAVTLLGGHLGLDSELVSKWRQASASADTKSDLRAALDTVCVDTDLDASAVDTAFKKLRYMLNGSTKRKKKPVIRPRSFASTCKRPLEKEEAPPNAEAGEAKEEADEIEVAGNWRSWLPLERRRLSQKTPRQAAPIAPHSPEEGEEGDVVEEELPVAPAQVQAQLEPLEVQVPVKLGPLEVKTPVKVEPIELEVRAASSMNVAPDRMPPCTSQEYHHLVWALL
jgi:hypothetical protein